MHKIGFLGLGVMGCHMALNVSSKQDVPVIAYDTDPARLDLFVAGGGSTASGSDEIYSSCDLILQMLPTHETIAGSVREAIKRGRPGNIIVDLSSASPDLITKLADEAKEAGMFLLDSPVSGGNPMAEAGTLSIMTGGDRAVYEKVKQVLSCMGKPVYTGPSGSGDTVKLINNMIGGAILAAMAEAYSLAEKAGLDLRTVFEATRGGFVGGPLYENKVPKIIGKDYEPGARIAVHYKDIVNAREYAAGIGAKIPLTDEVYEVMKWMIDNGYEDLDQAAMIRYYEQNC
jgi:2-hydroxy-3-oxopropionate reductase